MNDLKRELCNYLIKNNMVREYDLIQHNYTVSKFGNKCIKNNNISPTLDTRCDCLGVVIKEEVDMEKNNLRIRKLTPKECFRLMGVKDEDSKNLEHLSNATQYHLAGDSIVVNVLQAIFKSILIDHPIVDQKPIRLIELFGGYGSQALALKYLGVNFEHWKLCEWATHSVDAYKSIHFPNDNTNYSEIWDKEDLIEFLYNKGISSNWNEPMKETSVKRKSEQDLRKIFNNCKATHNLINIQQVHAKDLEIKERELYNYIVTYSFPCQDLSLAGKGAGMEKGSGTRSGMLWEVERILEECEENLPQILLMENVPQVAGKKNKEHFDKWIEFLESKGYTNKWCMLNAKEVGYPEPIPQNRNRCFMVSVLDPKQDIVFPEKIERKLVLKDLLESEMDEKYYLSDKQIESLESGSYNASKPSVKLEITDKGLCQTLDTMSGGHRQPLVRVEEKYYLSNKMIDYITSKDDKYKVNENNLVINRDIACSKTTREGNTRADTSDYICRELPENTNILKIKNATKQGYLEATEGDGIDISSRMQHHRGTVQKESTQTITTKGGNDIGVIIKENKWEDLD